MKYFILVLMVASTALMGCGKKEQGRAPISQRGGARGAGIGNDPQATNAYLDGQIYRYSSWSNSEFESEVRSFLSASVPTSYVGSVSGDYSTSTNSTGVFFGGQIAMSNGRFQQGVTGSISPSSNFLVAVYDSFTGQRDEEGNVIPAIPVYVGNATGAIQYEYGNMVLRAEFRDSLGIVKLKGTISGSIMQGEVSYQNFQNADGGTPASGHLGWFQVNVCDVMVCN